MAQALIVKTTPRAFDSQIGRDTVAALHGVDRDYHALIAGIAGSSPYLKSLIDRERDWLAEAFSDPDAAFAAELGAGSFEQGPEDLRRNLRRAKGRVALLCAICDLSGHWDLGQVTGALTRFAQQAVDLVLKSEIAQSIRRNKLPGATQDDVATAAGLSVLAMGKMGAFELNYSSDIDLICLFDETRYDPADFYEVRQAMVRATRNMSAALNDRTADGYVFRTDLRLRPDPSVTPVALAMEAAERYYESLGRTWERAAYIKARPCAGDIDAGARFLRTLTPFVWRKHLDFAAIEDAHAMRLRIRENKGTGGAISVPGHDMKLGRGGIREIEFFTQTRQLIAGGRDASLRVRATCEGLDALAVADWIGADVARTLSTHYVAHRQVEHRIQMIHDAQTHRVPQSSEGLARLACLMDCDAEQMQRDIRASLDEVHALTEDFFVPSQPAGAVGTSVQAAQAQFDPEVIDRWRTYPALRSDRGARIFERLKPEILARLAQSANPAEALLALDGFLAGMPAGVQIFSLFEANPQLIDLLVDIVGTSPRLAEYLSRNASVFDAVLDGGFFAPWPGREALQQELAVLLTAEGDYENALDTARRWHKEWHFRAGVHLLRGLSDPAEAGRAYADLAEAVIGALLPVVNAEFARKHGPMPGRGCVILGMGSLGAGQLSAQSDLDLIVIYDPMTEEMSQGRRPLAVRPYYARLTQALVTALTAPMAQGRLYEVDMRLRPSGSQGPVATSWASFTQYQTNEAWVWEHLALTRARVIAGDSALGADVEQFRAELIARPRTAAEVLGEVAQMRVRLAAAKSPSGIWDAKTGPGRMLDIELLAQAGALLSGEGCRGVRAGLLAAQRCGWLSDELGQELARAYLTYRQVLSAARLLAGRSSGEVTDGDGGRRFLLRSTGAETIDSLAATLEADYARCAALIDRVLAPFAAEPEAGRADAELTASEEDRPQEDDA